MIMAIISAQTLAVSNDDYQFIGAVSVGKDRGKNAYINTRWTKKHADFLLEGQTLEDTLPLLQKEVLETDNLFETLSCWFDQSCIEVLNPEEVHEFNELYKLSKDPETLPFITEDFYQEGITVAEIIMLNSMDILMEMSRRSGGN